MLSVREINAIEELASLRSDWEELLRNTPGATFFQSLPWLEIYWRHFRAGQQLRVLLVLEDDRPAAIVPLVVRLEKSRVGRLRVLTYPLDNWGSFYGPIGADAAMALGAAMEHIRRAPCNWDMLELRWIGAPGADPQQTHQALQAAGFQAYRTLWNQTATADFSGGWDEYLAGRKGIWLRRMRQSQERLSRQGRVSYVRCRPEGSLHGDGDPHWDLYDACEAIAQRSWQAAATDGTTLTHESVRCFLRDLHAAAAAAGAVDMNLLLLDNEPAAFIYGYHYQGYVYGLRRGFDARRSRAGLGAVLLWHTLQDSAQRGDRIYDMGTGSLESKRHFQNRLLPIYRFSHFPAGVFRTQLLRLSRWLKGRRMSRNTLI